MENIKVGDVVELKSGGPEMTVMEFDEGKLMCQWFEKDEEGAATIRELTLPMAAVHRTGDEA